MTNLTKSTISLAVAGFGTVAILALVPFSITTVPYGHVGVKSSFGKIDLNELEPGLHFIVPIVQHIDLVNTQVQAITYKAHAQGTA